MTIRALLMLALLPASVLAAPPVDPSSGKGLLQSHAATGPAERFTLAAHVPLANVLISEVAYTPTPWLRVAFANVVPSREVSFIARAQIRAEVLRADRVVLAVAAEYPWIGTRLTVLPQALFRGVAFLDLALDQEARVSLHLGAGAGAAPSGRFALDAPSGAIFHGELGVVGRVARHLKLLIETQSALILESDTRNGLSEAHPVRYGARFFTGEVAAELAFVLPFGAEDVGESLILGRPYLSATVAF